MESVCIRGARTRPSRCGTWSEAGENPQPKAWRERYPEFANESSAFFAGQKQIAALAGHETMGVEGNRPVRDLPTIRYFGDYPLLEEIARRSTKLANTKGSNISA